MIPSRISIVLGLLVASAPVAASHYQAEPIHAPLTDRIVLRDMVWQRNGGAFEAGKSRSRPAVVCAVFAKEVGPLKSFSIGGTPIAPGDLEKCNARAPRQD